MTNFLQQAKNQVLLQKTLLLAAVIVHHIIAVTNFWIEARVAYTICLAIAILLFLKHTIPVFLVFLLMASTQIYFPTSLSKFPSLPFLIPFLIMALIILSFPKLRSELDWIRSGFLDRWSKLWILVTAMSATLALILWGFWTDNLGPAVSMMKSTLNLPLWVTVAVIVPVFALVNAFSEEVIYRGVLQNSLAKVFGEFHLITHLLQASAFAMVHVEGGFPNGKTGYAMVLAYGLMLGYLKSRSKGMLAPFLTHVLADLTIGYFLIYQIQSSLIQPL